MESGGSGQMEGRGFTWAGERETETETARRVTAQLPVSQGDPRGSRCPEGKPDGPWGVDGLWWTHGRESGPLSDDVGP